jgi:transposase
MYDHYIAIDWAMSNMAIARMTAKSDEIKAIDVEADIKELQLYLKNLKGKKILTLEETTTSQWLFTELRDYVDEILVCDPYRNKLLSEGAKTDKIDAKKLVQLLKGGLLKRVFHSGDEFIYLRKIISGYEDVVKAGVRVKNQRSALFRANQKNAKEETTLDNDHESFVLEGLDVAIAAYEDEKFRYESEFKRLAKKHKLIRYVKQISGIGDINSVKVVARVVDGDRFDRNSWWCYCGLVKLKKISGNRCYGKKSPRYCRTMKSVFKMAALAAIGGNNQFNDLYEYLIKEKNYPDYKARHAVARRIATLVLGVLKSGRKFEPYRKRKYVDKKIAAS